MNRLAARSDWPLISGLALSGIGTLEAIAYTNGVETSADSFTVALNVLATAPLAARRNHLAAVAVTITLATLWLLADTGGLTFAGIAAQVWVLYLVASRYPRWAAVVAGVPFVLNGLAPFGGEEGGLTAAMMLVLSVAALVLGDSRRSRVRLVAERDAARSEQAAMGERARIARDLHDVVAHHISMIVVEADTTRLATEGMPDEGRRRLLSIRETAQDAMKEMRRVLGVLRDDAGGEIEHAPQPGLGRLAELVDASRQAGTPVRLRVHGQVVPLSAGVDLAAYRIVQEALTNTRRHAPGAAVDVELGYAAEALRLKIRDDGPGAANDTGGLGLLGMRERAATVGGTVRTGPADGGGFSVEADLPIPR